MNQYIGKSRGGNTTKIHAVVDGLGNPVCFELSGGNVNDNTVAIDLLSNIDIKSANILGDKAYGTKDIRNYITSQEADYTISPKSNTKDPWDCDWRFYKERHLVECFFNKIKHFEELLHDMTSWRLLFMPLFTLPRSGFCQNDQHFDFSDTP